MKTKENGGVILPIELSNKEIAEWIIDLAKFITEKGGGKIRFVKESGDDSRI